MNNSVLLTSSDVCTRLSVTVRSARGSGRHAELLVTALQSVVRDVPSVQAVVLHHEEYVKGYREESQSELGRVSEQRSPVIIVVRYHEHLEHAESAACEVQQDVPDAPSDGALSAEVHESLGYVFDEGDAELDVGTVEEEVQPDDDGCESEYEDDDDKQGDAGQDGEAGLGEGLIASLDRTEVVWWRVRERLTSYMMH